MHLGGSIPRPKTSVIDKQENWKEIASISKDIYKLDFQSLTREEK